MLPICASGVSCDRLTTLPRVTMAMNSANDSKLLARREDAALPLYAVVLDMVATGHPINEGELEVAATEDEARLGARAVAPAPQIRGKA